MKTETDNLESEHAVVREGHAFPEGWRATRLIDERTGNSCIGIDFPHRQGGFGFEVFDDDLAEQPKRVRASLKKRGAAFDGTKEDQIRFVARLMKKAPATLMLAMKPGMRGRDGFVLGKRMLGSAKRCFRWRPQSGTYHRGEIGDRRGNRLDWDQDVGKVALESAPLTFGLCLPLACPLPSYVLANSGRRLLSETAVFNLSGDSGSGKSSVVQAAAGIFGPPDLGRKWDFSRRGLEEYSESRNDLLAILDDSETHTEEASSLKIALRNVNQVITSGQSKLISVRAELPQLTWTTFGLTTSPEPLEKIAKEIGWKRTDGQRVRFIDIPVPKVDQAGIFDQLNGDLDYRIDTGKELIKQLNGGGTQNYGVIMPAWLAFLLAEDRSERVLKLTDQFIEHFLATGDGYDERLGKKFAVPAIAGYLAANHGIVPWPKIWPIKAAKQCYDLALKAIRKDVAVATEKLQLLAKLATDPDFFVPVKVGVGEPIRVDEFMLGIQTTYRGQGVLAIRDKWLDKFAGNSAISNPMIEQLRRRKILIGGHGHAGTTQLPVRIREDGGVVLKPRFWLVDPVRLREKFFARRGS